MLDFCRAIFGIILLAVIIVLIAVLAFLIHQAWLHAFGKRYFIRKAARKMGISKAEVVARFNEVLDKALTLCGKKGVEMRFSHHGPLSKRWELGMSTSFKCLRLIAFTPVWIYLIVTSPRLWTIAFLQSVGHELAHRDDPEKGGLGFYFRPNTERRCYYWLTEVRNDFAGLYFVLDNFGYSKGTVMNAMRKKADKYQEFLKRGKVYISHPSWNFRIALLKNNDCFDEAVFDAVVKASDCTNKSYIAELKNKMLNP